MYIVQLYLHEKKLMSNVIIHPPTENRKEIFSIKLPLLLLAINISHITVVISIYLPIFNALFVINVYWPTSISMYKTNTLILLQFRLFRLNSTSNKLIMRHCVDFYLHSFHIKGTPVQWRLSIYP